MRALLWGDTESAICARTSYYLLHILQEHPATKTIIIQETALIMRPTVLMLPSTASHPQPNRHIQLSKGQKSAPTREGNVACACTILRSNHIQSDRPVCIRD
jgi:hypothetical protein